MSAPIPVLSEKNSRAYPNHAIGRRAQYMPLHAVLSCRFPTDAHYAAYSCPAILRRLDSDAPAVIADGVPMVLFVADVDDPSAHREKRPASLGWHNFEEPKIRRLSELHPGVFFYQTRGGYRIVANMARPFIIRSAGDAHEWTTLYRRWVAYLHRVFTIDADPACGDWTRLYRVPWGTRDGVPQNLSTRGDPRNVGFWDPVLLPDDVGTPVRRNRKVVGISKSIELVPNNDDAPPDESTLPPLRQRIEWACLWIARQPQSIQGHGGSTPCFNVLLGLLRGWCLPVEVAREIFEKLYNVEPRCSPPWESPLVDHKIEQVLHRAEKPWGFILDDHVTALRVEAELKAARAMFWENYQGVRS